MWLPWHNHDHWYINGTGTVRGAITQSTYIFIIAVRHRYVHFWWLCCYNLTVERVVTQKDMAAITLVYRHSRTRTCYLGYKQNNALSSYWIAYLDFNTLTVNELNCWYSIFNTNSKILAVTYETNLVTNNGRNLFFTNHNCVDFSFHLKSWIGAFEYIYSLSRLCINLQLLIIVMVFL